MVPSGMGLGSNFGSSALFGIHTIQRRPTESSLPYCFYMNRKPCFLRILFALKINIATVVEFHLSSDSLAKTNPQPWPNAQNASLLKMVKGPGAWKTSLCQSFQQHWSPQDEHLSVWGGRQCSNWLTTSKRFISTAYQQHSNKLKHGNDALWTFGQSHYYKESSGTRWCSDCQWMICMGDPFKNFQPICKTCKRYNQLNQISIFTLINTYIIIPIDTYVNIFHFSNIQPSQSAPTVSLKKQIHHLIQWWSI